MTGTNSWWSGTSTATNTTGAATWKTPTLDEMVCAHREFMERFPPLPSPLPYACSVCKRVSPKDRTDPRYFEPRPVYYHREGVLPHMPVMGPPVAYACTECWCRLVKHLVLPDPAPGAAEKA